MILAIPIEDNTQHSLIALRFARAPYFAVADRENRTLNIIPNPCLGMTSQAGKCTVLYLATRQKVGAILAYELGHKAFQLTQEHAIQLILLNERNKRLDQLLKLMHFTKKEYDENTLRNFV